jgi:putative flippase GtrA
MKILTNPRERTRFLRFAVVGTIGAAVDFGVFNLFTSVFHVVPVVSSVISFIAAVTNNFVLNRNWTYPDSRSKSITRQLIEFIIVNVIGLAIRTPIFAFLETQLVKFFASSSIALPLGHAVLGHNIALAVAIGVVILWNFFINRYWTFSDVD